MVRDMILQKMKDAKQSHSRWLRRVKHLVENLPVEDSMIPLDPSTCSFGCWLYDEGMKCKISKKISNTINMIEKEHTYLHDVYLQIYRIYFVETKKHSVRSLVFGKKKLISTKKKKEAIRYYKELENISQRLNSEIDKLQRSIMGSSDDAISKCAA